MTKFCIISHKRVCLPLLNRPILLPSVPPWGIRISLVTSPSQFRPTPLRGHSHDLAYPVCAQENPASRPGAPAVAVRALRLHHQHHRQECHQPGPGGHAEERHGPAHGHLRGGDPGRAPARGALPGRPDTGEPGQAGRGGAAGRPRGGGPARRPDVRRHHEQRVGAASAGHRHAAGRHEGPACPAGQVAARTISRPAAIAAFNTLVDDGDQVLNQTIRQETDSAIVAQALAFVRIGRVGDLLGQEDAILLGDLSTGSFPAADRRQFSPARRGPQVPGPGDPAGPRPAYRALLHPGRQPAGRRLADPAGEQGDGTPARGTCPRSRRSPGRRRSARSPPGSRRRATSRPTRSPSRPATSPGPPTCS